MHGYGTHRAVACQRQRPGIESTLYRRFRAVHRIIYRCTVGRTRKSQRTLGSACELRSLNSIVIFTESIFRHIRVSKTLLRSKSLHTAILFKVERTGIDRTLLIGFGIVNGIAYNSIRSFRTDDNLEILKTKRRFGSAIACHLISTYRRVIHTLLVGYSFHKKVTAHKHRSFIERTVSVRGTTIKSIIDSDTVSLTHYHHMIYAIHSKARTIDCVGCYRMVDVRHTRFTGVGRIKEIGEVGCQSYVAVRHRVIEAP